jgi:hypothetical protein
MTLMRAASPLTPDRLSLRVISVCPTFLVLLFSYFSLSYFSPGLSGTELEWDAGGTYL